MRLIATLTLVLWVGSSSVQAQEPPKTESTYTKLLKAAPAARQGAIVDVIGKRGTAADLAAVFERALNPYGFAPEVRLKALTVIAEAAATRNVRPEGDLSGIARLFQLDDNRVDLPTRLAAIRLAGVVKSESAIEPLSMVVTSPKADSALRSAALEALATIGGPAVRARIEALTSDRRSTETRVMGVAALARLDLDAAVERAAGIVAVAKAGIDLTPMMSAILDRQGGSDKLTAALARKPPSADGAKLALRAIYSLGRADEALVAELSKAAEIQAEAKPLEKAELEKLVAEVNASGNAVRGEAIFRRAELNCMKCHAVSQAAGGVGPELSALGLSSPVDYVINSIIVPDQAIKEEYQTKVILTTDGRVLQGIVVEKDDTKLVLKDATAELRTVPADTIEDSKEGGSLMPKGLANLLTRAEFVDLVKFLSELGKPGPYAIKSVPTIQRWRVLKGGVPELDHVLKGPTRVSHEAAIAFQSEPSQWIPAYARVGGDLPLDELGLETSSKSVWLEGEINVSSPGRVVFRLDSDAGVDAWVGRIPGSAESHPIVHLAGGDAPSIELAEGRHAIVFRVDRSVRKSPVLRVQVEKGGNSPVEFSVVGGR
jgi:putative heme-binding domain-containing protein